MYTAQWRADAQPPRLSLEGDIDLAARDQVVSTGLRAAPREDGTLIVDLAQVTFFDGSGARAILELRSGLARRGTKLRLVNVPPCVARTFERIGVPTMARCGRNQN